MTIIFVYDILFFYSQNRNSEKRESFKQFYNRKRTINLLFKLSPPSLAVSNRIRRREKFAFLQGVVSPLQTGITPETRVAMN